jgi:hypothetical protein
MEHSIKPAFQLAGPPVASRPGIDRFVTLDGSHLVVTTSDGRLFCHFIGLGGDVENIGNAVQFTGPPVAAQPVDRHVLLSGGRLLVITANGDVFCHRIPNFEFFDEPRQFVEPAFRLDGPPVAANPQDRSVFRAGSGLIVLTWDGGVFGHRLEDGNKIGPAFRYDGPPVAANKGVDKWVVLLGHSPQYLLVVTDDGRAFCHEIEGTTVKDAFPVPGPPVAAQPVDHYLLTEGSKIYVITNDGRVFQHLTVGFDPIIK